jgi:hypothetical protein
VAWGQVYYVGERNWHWAGPEGLAAMWMCNCRSFGRNRIYRTDLANVVIRLAKCGLDKAGVARQIRNTEVVVNNIQAYNLPYLDTVQYIA